MASSSPDGKHEDLSKFWETALMEKGLAFMVL
jgi:hypothetical protein